MDGQSSRRLPNGHIIAIRLCEGSNDILDYFLLPTTEMIGRRIRFMEAGLHRFDGRRFRTSAHLTKAILHKIVGRASPTKPAQLTKQSKSRRPKKASGRARR